MALTDPTHTAPARSRVRVRFSKLGKVRFTSHRDVARIWERGLRKAEVPVAYSEGFSPRPRISFGLALSTGHESLAEYLDAEVRGLPCPVDDLAARLTDALPAGLDATATDELIPGAASLQQDVVACTWQLTLTGTTAAIAAAQTAAALAAPSIVVSRSRKGHQVVDDLRPAIERLAVIGEDDRGVIVEAELATLERGVRPAELVAACYLGAGESRVLRTHQWIERDGVRREPLAAGAPSPHAIGACA
jgi:radical SAM-linked protein